MKFTRLSICGLTIAFAILMLGNAPGPTPSDEASAVLRISNLRMRAIFAHDMVTWGRYTSEQLQTITEEGHVLTKSEVMASKPEPYPDTGAWVGRPSVRFIGDTALVSGKVIETEKYPGGTVVTNFARTELYAREHGEWMEQASQVTILQKNYTKGMTNPPTVLTPFTGRYEWAPGMIETLSIVGSRLVSTLDGTPDPLIFISPDATTQADDLGIGTFYRDASGKVAGYVYQRCDGQTIRIPKI